MWAHEKTRGYRGFAVVSPEELALLLGGLLRSLLGSGLLGSLFRGGFLLGSLLRGLLGSCFGLHFGGGVLLDVHAVGAFEGLDVLEATVRGAHGVEFFTC